MSHTTQHTLGAIVLDVCVAGICATVYLKYASFVHVRVNCSAADVKELERAVTNTIKSENADIKQKMDSARLPIHHCQLVIINTHTPPLLNSDIKDAPLTQVGVQTYMYTSVEGMEVCRMHALCSVFAHVLFAQSLRGYGNAVNQIQLATVL